jgi:hypothetical protein
LFLTAPATGLQATVAQLINYVILVIVLVVAGFQVTDRFLLNTTPAANPSSTSPTITDIVRVSLPVGEVRSLCPRGWLLYYLDSFIPG